MAYALPVPERILGPREGRDDRVYLDDERCVVRDPATYLVRGHLKIPVHDNTEPFAYTVWVSLSAANFRRALDLWTTDGREHEPLYFGWLVNTVPGYPKRRS